jgi:1-acyl-sn-glycerol-3-phosphate acyltransferase
LILYFLDATSPFWYKGPGKKSLFKIPVMSTILAANGVVPIDRTNLQSAIKSLNSLAKECKKHGHNIIIAPEGKRRRRPSEEFDNFLPFKKGMFHLALENQLAILPVIFVGANRTWPTGRLWELSRSGAFLLLTFRAGTG